MRDGGPAIPHALCAQLALESETTETKDGRQTPIERGAAEALRDLGEHAAAPLDVTPSEVEMEPGRNIAQRLRDVGRHAALIVETAVPVRDGTAAQLDQQLLVEVHPDIGSGDPADDEVGLIGRYAFRDCDSAVGARRRAEHERIDTGTIEAHIRRPRRAAAAARAGASTWSARGWATPFDGRAARAPTMSRTQAARAQERCVSMHRW